ncbi:hypothetical protein PPL_01916 [Heterostelium album PN500]|uniref:Uncharacterized protein n=1 Tax=Heterostelium pallidum (strain ATCC 26659 / Pp 5 / PN500) TaxID=670386 RepID=D3B0U9_HETP5|nr:hypothetical protein PPL_01916 [Heterostelium album PN500]EFA84923.1 hypothetical protein PPL_01916 [Heterostelium album PN500]|eukprot:XP_020437033.1 hypothetical protein PPL_01916 [Heterostelium album PN500]
MKEYSLKHSGLKKDLLIDAIINHQEHLADLNSKLVTDNTIDKYHRGTVEYRLPTLIIYRIIRDLWHDDINFNLKTKDLCRKYRRLLSIALVSKELFKLISSLFTRFQLITGLDSIYDSNYLTDILAVKIKNHYLHPLSIVKNIRHFTLSMEIFKEINNLSTSFELGVIFKDIRKLSLICVRIKDVQVQQIKSMIKYMSSLESLRMCGAVIDSIKIFQLLRQIPQLTSLDFLNTKIQKINFSSELISSSLKKLKLPEIYGGYFLSILPSHSQVTTFGFGYITLEQITMIGSHFKNITKLVLWRIYRTSESKLEELLCSPECKVHTLYVGYRYSKWLENVLPKNQSIETIDVGENLLNTFSLAWQSSSINRFIFHENFEVSEIIMNSYRPTGYIHIKSKFRFNPGKFLQTSIGPIAHYAKKIYNVLEIIEDNFKTIESTYPNFKFLYYKSTLNELDKMNRNELEEIMVKYSLKQSGLKNDTLIDAIIKHQEHLIDLKSKLVTNNSMEQYHRGTVEYRLPTLIIYRIIRDLWHNDINLNLITKDLHSKYRWLFSIALVSKEFFKLISSMFTRFLHIGANYSYIYDGVPVVTAVRIKNHFLNPHSIIKNISHLTLSMEIFVGITSESTSTSVELGVIFNNVRKLKLIDEFIKDIQVDQIQSMIQYMPNLCSFKLCHAVINNIEIFQMLKLIPLLTTLDLEMTKIKNINFTSKLISSSLRKLKLPEISGKDKYLSILPNESKVTTFGLVFVDTKEIKMLSNHFKNITKLIFWRIYNSAESELEELLCSPECKVRTLYFDYRFQKWLERVLSKNQSIEIIDIGEDLSLTFWVASKSSSINRLIFHENHQQSDIYSKELQPTGYIHIKSKYRYNPCTSVLNIVGGIANYAKKIYNVSENTDDNQAIEATYPNHKFLYN